MLWKSKGFSGLQTHVALSFNWLKTGALDFIWPPDVLIFSVWGPRAKVWPPVLNDRNISV